MTKYRTDLRNWPQLYDYLLQEYKNRESKYVQGSAVAKPDVIVPKSNVPNAKSTGYFRKTNRSFDLGSEYNVRHKTAQCSIQVRKYDNGTDMYESLHHDNNVYLGADVPESVQSVDEPLYYVQLNWKNPEATSFDDISQSVRSLIGHLFLDVIGYNPGQAFEQYCTGDIKCDIN